MGTAIAVGATSQRIHLEWASAWVAKMKGFQWENGTPKGDGDRSWRDFAESTSRVGLSMGDEKDGISKGK